MLSVRFALCAPRFAQTILPKKTIAIYKSHKIAIKQAETRGKNIAEAITHFETTPSESTYKIEIAVQETETITHKFNRELTP